MSTWQDVPAAAHLKPGEMTHHALGTTDVLVLNVDGELRAFVNRCGHMNAPLDLGTLKGSALKCPAHNAVFDARTGEIRGEPVMGMHGLDPTALPKALLDQMARMGPIMARTACLPLTPLPIAVSKETVQVWA
jgi:toluene monooxygenase system ferredoxin subunit